MCSSQRGELTIRSWGFRLYSNVDIAVHLVYKAIQISVNKPCVLLVSLVTKEIHSAHTYSVKLGNSSEAR